MDNSPALALNAPQNIVNRSYRAIMPQDRLLGIGVGSIIAHAPSTDPDGGYQQ